MSYRKTVVGVIYQDNEFLLVQKPHWKNWWDFPQGGVDDRESLEQALMRELGEELGTSEFGEPSNTNITLERLFSPETFEHYPDKGYTGKKLFYFTVPFLGNKNNIRLGDDLSAKKWCDENHLLELVYKEQIDAVRQVLEFLKHRK